MHITGEDDSIRSSRLEGAIKEKTLRMKQGSQGQISDEMMLQDSRDWIETKRVADVTRDGAW